MSKIIKTVPGENLTKATPAKDNQFFDAEEHFKNYDHEAVLNLSRKTLIAPLCHNRKGTVEQCLGATYKHRLESKMYVHDDSSNEYDEKWLEKFGDRVFRHPRSKGGKEGVKNLRSNITKSVLGEFHPELFTPWLQEDFGPEGPEFLYHVDSDGYHDPHFFYRLHEIMTNYPEWGVICLYNAEFHSPRKGRAEKTVFDGSVAVRGISAGISMFFRVSDFRDNPKHVQVPDRRGWDGFYSQTIGKRRIATSLTSFVEHLGRGGFHNVNSWDRDRALNPTKYLASIRKDAIAAIESCNG